MNPTDVDFIVSPKGPVVTKDEFVKVIVKVPRKVGERTRRLVEELAKEGI